MSNHLENTLCLLLQGSIELATFSNLDNYKLVIKFENDRQRRKIQCILCVCIFIERILLVTESFLGFISRSKEIEFVVPPTVSPYGSNRYLNNMCRPVGTVSDHLTPNYTPSYANRTTSNSSEDGTPVINVVNKGWNMLQDVFTSSTSLNIDGSKKSNR